MSTSPKTSVDLWDSNVGMHQQNHRSVIQRCKNKILRGIFDVPWYIRNDNLHKDLNVETVNEVIRKKARSHEQRLQQHPNPDPNLSFRIQQM